MDERPDPADDRTEPMPAWVKVLGALAAGLVLLVVGLHLTGHVPSHHFGATGHAAQMGSGPAAPR